MVNEIITITSKTKQKSQHLREQEIVQNYWNENHPMFSFNYYTQQYHFLKNWHLDCLLKTVWIRKPKGERKLKINMRRTSWCWCLNTQDIG